MLFLTSFWDAVQSVLNQPETYRYTCLPTLPIFAGVSLFITPFSRCATVYPVNHLI